MELFNLEAERGALGTILIDPRFCDELATVVRPDDFYEEKHRKIYRCLLAMNAESTGIDLALLTDRLRKQHELEDVGGEAYLAELMTSVPVTIHARYYARIVAEYATRRALIDSCESIAERATALEPLQELVSAAEERIINIGDRRLTSKLLTPKDYLPRVAKLVDSLMTGENDGLTTGLDELDKLISLRNSELIILAARPSMGKTALATNIASHVAFDLKLPVAFFTFEMSLEEIALRIVCSRASLNAKKVVFWSKKETTRFNEVFNELQESSLVIADTSGGTVGEIGALSRRMKRTSGLSLIVIDYLGLIEPDNASDPRQEQVAKMSRRLKRLARELDVPVLCLAQLNRQAEATKDNRPRLSHLRESGAIEQDADIVMFVHREEYYHKKEDAEAQGLSGLAEIIVAKQRNGPVGEAKVSWISRYTLFGNIETPESEYYDDFSKFGGNNGQD